MRAGLVAHMSARGKIQVQYANSCADRRQEDHMPGLIPEIRLRIDIAAAEQFISATYRCDHFDLDLLVLKFRVQ